MTVPGAPAPWYRDPVRLTRLAVAAAAAAATASAATHAALSPAFSSGDEAAHLDYAYQVWTGGLPVFEEGLVVQPPVGYAPPVQWVAQHPPLYYLLQAPVVGPLVDLGRPVLAAYAGRALNALLAAALVLVVAWAAAQVAPRTPRLRVAAAVVVAASAWVARVGGAVYNDLLAAATATLVMGATVALLRHGGSRARWALLAAACAAALLTRAALVVVIAACLAALVIDAVVRSRGWHAVLTTSAAAAATLVVAVLPSSWFWWRNVRLTGDVLGGHPEWAAEHLDRVSRPWTDVLTDVGSWRALWSLHSHDVLPRGTTTTVLLVVPVALALVGLAVVARREVPRAREHLAVLVALGGPVVAVLGMQVLYAAGGGGLNARYLMPLLLPVGLAVGAGLTWSRRAAPWLLGAWAAAASVENVVRVRRALLSPPSDPLVHPGVALVAASAAIVALTVTVALHARLCRVGGRPAVPQVAGD